MGITNHSARFLVAARRAGVDFSKTLMLGRQDLFLEGDDLVAVGIPHEDARGIVAGRYAEPLLIALGASHVDSLDVSDFEGATILHDLNQPLPAELDGRYTAVLDGGTLEHIFNFPVALASAMRLTALGGHLLLMTPANNWLGHGFYQFSPEVFFRTLSEENGFECERILLKSSRSRGAWWELMDPARAGGRGELLTSRPMTMYVQARRVAERPVLASAPQQSDYVAEWHGEPSVEPAATWRTWLQRSIDLVGLNRLSQRFDPVSGFTGLRGRVPDQRYFRRARL